MVGENLHVVLVPFAAQGHIIPTLDLARLLAGQGVLVTLVSTPVNLSRIQPFVRQVQEFALPIKFLSLRFPCAECGLPAGCENFDLVNTLKDSLTFCRAGRLMHEPLKLHLQQTSPSPSCIVADYCNPWVRHVARELGIPLFLFYPIPCFSQLCDYNLAQRRAHGGVAGDDGSFVVPNMPVRIEVIKDNAAGIFPDPVWTWMADDIAEAVRFSDGILVNTFEDLEPTYIELLAKAKGKKVWPVGPVSLCNKLASDLSSRGDTASIGEEQCTEWLDSKEPRSVLYVSFGTVVKYPLAQLMEIGLGLEATLLPVIWVIKSRALKSDVEDWLAQGFEERTKGRILIIRGWAPQVMILSHPAVGGFLTHCGWNSLLEGITAGIPSLTSPGGFDQFFNERFLVDVLKLGISYGLKNPFWEGGMAREVVTRTVMKLMARSGEGEELRRRATEMGQKARSAMDIGGSSQQALVQFISEVRLLARKHGILISAL